MHCCTTALLFGYGQFKTWTDTKSKWVGETDSKGDTHCNNPPQCYFLRIEIVLCMVVVRYLIWRDEQLHKNLGYCLSYRFIEKYYVWLGVTYIGLDSKKVLTSSSS